MTKTRKAFWLDMARVLVLFAVVSAAFFSCVGCGPSKGELRRQAELDARERLRVEVQQAVSQVRTLHEKLDGQLLEDGLFRQDNPVSENDPWGNPIEIVYRKNTELSCTLIVRSSGPDGHPNNADDIVKTGTRFRKDATKEEVEKITRGLSRGFVSGVVDGISGREQKKK